MCVCVCVCVCMCVCECVCVYILKHTLYMNLLISQETKLYNYYILLYTLLKIK